jgi:hypothetical protein
VADFEDKKPTIHLKWDEPKTINSITLYFDTDFDHPMESSQMGHPEDVIPFCVRKYQIYDSDGNPIFYKDDNYQSINVLKLNNTIKTDSIIIKFDNSMKDVSIAIFEIQIN